MTYTKKYKCCIKFNYQGGKIDEKKLNKIKIKELILKMKKSRENPDVLKKLIIQHTTINIQIRKKLKVMISKMPVPEPIEKIILDFVGMPKFAY